MDKFNIEHIKSGYVVRLRNGELRMLTRVGSAFTKILVGSSGQWDHLSSWSEDLTFRAFHDGRRYFEKEHDIMEIYGLVEHTGNYAYSLDVSTDNRKLLWKRSIAVRMTVSEINARLGFEVEIVAES